MASSSMWGARISRNICAPSSSTVASLGADTSGKMHRVTRLRVVLISMYVGHEGVPHAGGRYLLELQRLLDAETDLTMLTVGNRLNHEAASKQGVPRRLFLLGHEPGRNPVGQGPQPPRRAGGRAVAPTP